MRPVDDRRLNPRQLEDLAQFVGVALLLVAAPTEITGAAVGIAGPGHDPAPEVVGAGGQTQGRRRVRIESRDPRLCQAALQLGERCPVVLVRIGPIGGVDRRPRPVNRFHVAHRRRHVRR